MERRQPRPRSTKRVNVRIKGPMVPPIGLTLRSYVPHATAAEHVCHEAETQPRPRAVSAEETTEGAAMNLERNPGLVLSQLRRRPRAPPRTRNATQASCLKLRAHTCPRATLHTTPRPAALAPRPPFGVRIRRGPHPRKNPVGAGPDRWVSGGSLLGGGRRAGRRRCGTLGNLELHGRVLVHLGAFARFDGSDLAAGLAAADFLDGHG